MGYDNKHQTVTEEDRREFLKVLGITGSVAVGGFTVSELRRELSAGASGEFAPIGKAIKSDLTGALNADLLTTQQAAFIGQATAIPTVVEKGFPVDGPRDDFASVAEAGWPVYDHLTEVGFFDSTTQHIPDFTPEYLVSSVEQFITSGQLAEILAPIGFGAAEMVDLFVALVNGRHELSNQLWLATDEWLASGELPPEMIEGSEFVPPMTQQASGGVLLWLNDLDSHLALRNVLLTDEILGTATWDAHAMAAGLHLTNEGAKIIAEESSLLSNSELGSLFTTGFSLQIIAQHLLASDAYWITEEMRDARNTDLKPITID